MLISEGVVFVLDELVVVALSEQPIENAAKKGNVNKAILFLMRSSWC